MIDHLISKGTIKVLEELLERSKKGEIIGIAFVSIIRGRRPYIGWAGYAGQDPLFTLGAIKKLDRELLNKAIEKGY